MEYVEAEGNSIDEAIARALELLGVSRDKVDVDILSNATRGLFGFGGRRAKVRATVRRRLAVDGGAPASAPPPAAAAPSGNTHRPATEPRRSEARSRAAMPTSAPARPARPPEARPTPRPKSERPRERRPAPVARVEREPAAEAPPIDGAALDRARTILAELVRLIGSDATVEPGAQSDGVHLVIRGDPSGVLIGRRGQTLDAIEYLLNRMLAQEEDGSGSRLIVDAEGYRQRRRQALEELARRVADRARRRGKPVTLNPMSPRDRRIVHLTLQDDPTLTTRSAGSGFYRKIVIVPQGGGSRRG